MVEKKGNLIGRREFNQALVLLAAAVLAACNMPEVIAEDGDPLVGNEEPLVEAGGGNLGLEEREEVNDRGDHLLGDEGQDELRQEEEEAVEQPGEFPLPEGVVDPRFVIGSIDFGQAYSLIVPGETLAAGGMTDEQLNYEINQPLLLQSSWGELMSGFNDYYGHPGTTVAALAGDGSWGGEIDNRLILYAHTYDGLAPLPADWIRVVFSNLVANVDYTDPEILAQAIEPVLGREIIFEQEIGDRRVMMRMRISDLTYVTGEEFMNSDYVFGNEIRINIGEDREYVEEVFSGLHLIRGDEGDGFQRVTMIGCMQTLPDQQTGDALGEMVPEVFGRTVNRVMLTGQAYMVEYYQRNGEEWELVETRDELGRVVGN